MNEWIGLIFNVIFHSFLQNVIISNVSNHFKMPPKQSPNSLDDSQFTRSYDSMLGVGHAQ